MNNIDNYIKLLRCSLNGKYDDVDFVSEINWHDLLLFGKKQTIVGILWQGINGIFESENVCGDVLANKPTDDDVMEWIEYVGEIKKKNELLDKKSRWVCKNFDTEGFESCILKGQGNALLYPNPYSRNPGDIDILVADRKFIPPAAEVNDRNNEKNINSILSYCRGIRPNTMMCYHHIDFPISEKVDVEVHYRPSWMNNPFYNRRMQRYFQLSAPVIFKNVTNRGFAVPTAEYNAIFQLSHIYKHLLSSGVGLRQLTDYFYLLRNGWNEDDRKAAEKRIKAFGLAPIASAVMWVLHNIMGMDERFLIFKMNERRGKILYREIANGGNFGFFNDNVVPPSEMFIAHNYLKLKRVFSLWSFFPDECAWEPLFRLYHWLWRKRH